MTNSSNQRGVATTASPPNLPTEKAHLAFLDGLRACAALFVVLHHAYLHVNDGGRAFHGLLASVRGLSYGHYAVGLFIVLSGYCLMLPVARGNGTLRGGSIEFLSRRARRILPPYFAAMLFSLALIGLFIGHKTGTHWDMSLPVTWKSVWTHLFLLQDAFGQDYTINHVFWSIAVEWRIYFFFPIFVLLWRKTGALSTIVIALLISGLFYKLTVHLIGSAMSWHYLGLFALGCLGSGITFEPQFAAWRRLPWLWLLLGSSALLAIATKIPLWHGQGTPLVICDYLVGVWGLTLLVYLSVRPQSVLHRFLSWKPVAFLGTFAYSIYLIHAPLQQLFWQTVLRPLHLSPQATFWALVLATPLIVAVAYGFFLVAERPFLSQKAKTSVAQVAA